MDKRIAGSGSKQTTSVSSSSNSDSVEPELQSATDAPVPPPSEEVETIEATGVKKRSNASDCWDHFIRNSNGLSAKCRHCQKSILTKQGSTGGMKKHILVCKSNPATRADKKQKTIELCRAAGSDQGSIKLRQYTMTGYRQKAVEFIVMDEQPFRAVEGKGFQNLMRYMNPAWEPVSRITIAKDVMKRFQAEKLKLKNMLVGHRVSFTSDTWTSIQNLNYMVVTAHWIDDAWNIQKRIIGFFQVGDHRGETICQELLSCFSDWGIKDVQSITLDNATSNDVAAEKARRKMLVKEGQCLHLNGEMFHMRCTCHIVNLVVGDGLQFLGPYIDTIRKAVRYVRSSPARLKKFKECVALEEIKSNALLSLDVPTRWNSTYLMLQAAVKYRKVFDRMNEDLNYVSFFGGADRPDDVVWDQAEMFITFLKNFYDLTIRLSGTTYSTANLCFRDICAVKKELNVLLGKEKDSFLERMGKSMDAKFGKYWGDPEKVNLVVFFGTLLDPRYKLIYIDHCLKSVFGEEVSNKVVPIIEKKFYELFKEYDDGTPAQDSSVSVQSDSVDIDEASQMTSVDELDSSFLKNVINTQETDTHEIEKYLNAKPEGTDIKRQSFDVLLWWKDHCKTYRVLAKIAKDVLAVPVSTVASESAFSGGGRILDPFRSSLTPSTVEALILLRNWLHANNEVSVLGNYMDEVISYEDSLKVEEPEPEPDAISGPSAPVLTGGSSNVKLTKKDKGKAKRIN